MSSVIRDWRWAAAVLVVLAAWIGPREIHAQRPLPADFVIPTAESSPGPVTFSHARHAAVPTCATCHATDYKMKRGASGPITLEAKQEGKFCGSCHDGKTVIAAKTVFAIDQCDTCHRERPAASEPVARAGDTSPASTSQASAAPPPSPPAGTSATGRSGPSAAGSGKASRTAGATPASAGSEDCLACHADKDLQRSAPRASRRASVFVDKAVLDGSRHAGLECVACHATATAPHDEKLPRVDCAGCHTDSPGQLGSGVHGRAVAARAGSRAPTCTACHGTHDVRAPASVGAALCATCHAAEVKLYRDGVHGQSRARGNSEAATCTSCHGSAHTLLAASDPEAPTYHLSLPRTCAQCHGDPELARRYGIPVENAYQLYMDSIHGRALSRSGLLVAANCSDCHGAHDIRPRTDARSRVNRANVPATCATCHAGIHVAYAESIHGRAVAAGTAGAPVCTDCHSAHRIRRVEESQWTLDVIGECGTCHEESLKTYRDTFHGKVTQLGGTRVAKCADCHGAHDIQPAADPRSRVSEARIVETCQQCHPGATVKFTEFHPHADPHDRERFPKLYYSYRFMTTILVGTFTFFGLHTLVWLPRSVIERRRARRRDRQADSPGGEVRER